MTSWGPPPPREIGNIAGDETGPGQYKTVETHVYKPGCLISPHIEAGSNTLGAHRSFVDNQISASMKA